MYDSVGTGKNQSLFAACTHDSGYGRYEYRRVDEQGRPVQSGHQGPVFKRLLQVPCATLGRGQRCPCVLCRQSWARIESAVRAKSFETRPPTHFVVLKYPTRSPSEFVAVVDRFVRRLRDLQTKLRKQGTELEWNIDLEESPGEPPHVHVLIRTNADDALNLYTVVKSPDAPPAIALTKSLLRSLWSSACCDDAVAVDVHSNIRVYCEPIRDAERSARYTTKFWLEKDGHRWRLVEPWLPGPEWHGVRLHRPSRGFYAASREDLYAMVKRDWFVEEVDDTETLPDWQPPSDDALNLYTVVKSPDAPSFRDNSRVIWTAAPDLEATVQTYSPFESGYTLRLHLDTERLEALPAPIQDRLYRPVPASQDFLVRGVKSSELSLPVEPIPWPDFCAMLDKIGRELDQVAVPAASSIAARVKRPAVDPETVVPCFEDCRKL